MIVTICYYENIAREVNAITENELGIGKKLQVFRKSKKITIRGLSAMTGITGSMISQIENNQVNPSINSLKLIATALEIPIYLFFQNDDSVQDIVVRRDSRKTIGLPGDDTTYELLTPDVQSSIEFCLMTIPPQNDSGKFLQSHSGEEVCFVVEGSVSIIIGSKKYDLYKGDSIRIPNSTQHRWINNTKEEAKVIFAINPPSF